MSIYLWMGLCMWVQYPQRPDGGNMFTGARVIGSCELPNMES